MILNKNYAGNFTSVAFFMLIMERPSRAPAGLKFNFFN
jgi:hypothetical protein